MRTCKIAHSFYSFSKLDQCSGNIDEIGELLGASYLKKLKSSLISLCHIRVAVSLAGTKCILKRCNSLRRKVIMVPAESHSGVCILI